MKIAAYFKRIISKDKTVVRGAGTLRTVLCGLFIALIALFRTSPVNERSLFDKPLPLPAELGLDELTLGVGAAQAPNSVEADKR